MNIYVNDWMDVYYVIYPNTKTNTNFAGFWLNIEKHSKNTQV